LITNCKLNKDRAAHPVILQWLAFSATIPFDNSDLGRCVIGLKLISRCLRFGNSTTKQSMVNIEHLKAIVRIYQKMKMEVLVAQKHSE